MNKNLNDILETNSKDEEFKNSERLERDKRSANQKSDDIERGGSKAMSEKLRIIGGIMIALGIVVGILLLIKLSEGGMFSKGGITIGGVLISAIVAFYHYVLGMICFGIADIFDSKDIKIMDQYYSNSGSKLEKNTVFCSNCGTKVESDVVFCPKCEVRIKES